TLTIEPGVVVKGREGAESNATALMVARGGKLIAEGTSDSPIIFTSVTDKILPGEKVSPNLSPTVNGLWGGLLILGKAPISAEAEAMQIEGIPPSDLNGLYGGSVPDDNSGSLKFISIRHGGTNIGEGNEINGLTLGGVGSGTVIENIEIVANQDDGIEWFGGTVNVKNVIVWNTGDDAIDTDQSWAGTLDNFIIVNPGDECFELDGPEGTLAARHTLKNGTVYAGNAQGIADLDDALAASDSWVDISHIYFFGLKAGQTFDKVPTYYTCTFSNFEATLPAGSVLTDFFKDGSDVFTTTVNEGARTVGADVTAFSAWSWAAVSGSLTGFQD
ncbi:MAG TPA: right-handed parallel beta-helix repeat-containing protein, partial [Bacteroidales bacterium]|nr:right-handed parallel beta-helix repeat-containing protein [Bacteroidales bacterium]